MSRDQALRAIAAGIELARELAADGVTASRARRHGHREHDGGLRPARLAAGRRAGARLQAGHGARRRGSGRRSPWSSVRSADPLSGESVDTLAALGGFEIALLTGAILGAASERLAIVLDGSSSAPPPSSRGAPASAYLIAGHLSPEPGHRLALDELGLDPLLALELRLGEGTGAALALPPHWGRRRDPLRDGDLRGRRRDRCGPVVPPPPRRRDRVSTRVPVGRFIRLDGRAVREGAPLYPLVGAAVGAVAGASVDVLAGPLPAWAAATIGVGLAALLTGGMHLDALADTADALGGGTRERRLEIMRDHSIGAFGAVALVLVLLLEVSLLAELGSRDLALVSFAAAGALSRWSPLPIALALPYARDDGRGRSLATGSRSRPCWSSRPGSGNRRDRARRGAAPALGAAAGVALLLGLFYRRWLGGVTGDALGAAAPPSRRVWSRRSRWRDERVFSGPEPLPP